MPLVVLPRWSDISPWDLHYAQPQMMQISLQIAAKITRLRDQKIQRSRSREHRTDNSDPGGLAATKCGLNNVLRREIFITIWLFPFWLALLFYLCECPLYVCVCVEVCAHCRRNFKTRFSRENGGPKKHNDRRFCFLLSGLCRSFDGCQDMCLLRFCFL